MVWRSAHDKMRASGRRTDSNMKIFDLACDNEHRFEGWFASSEEFDSQLSNHLVACPLCGSSQVTKLPAAVYVKSGRTRPPAARAETPAQERLSVAYQQQVALKTEMMAKLIEQVVKNTEDVGSAFPEEARKIHYKESPPRHIRGTASSDQVAELKDEGIEVMVLPIAVPADSKPH